MEAKLKEALIDKIQAAQDELKNPRVVKALLEKWGPQTSLNRDRKGPKNALYSLVHRKLRKARLWDEAREALAEVGFEGFLRNLERSQGAKTAKKEISAARALQLGLFPGFEALPTRIRIGAGYIKFPKVSVSQYLAWESKEQAKAVTNHQRAEEIHRIAEKVQQFAETDPDLALAEAFGRAEAQPARLSVVR